jgi:hypothetical protein
MKSYYYKQAHYTSSREYRERNKKEKKRDEKKKIHDVVLGSAKVDSAMSRVVHPVQYTDPLILPCIANTKTPHIISQGRKRWHAMPMQRGKKRPNAPITKTLLVADTLRNPTAFDLLDAVFGVGALHARSG